MVLHASKLGFVSALLLCLGVSTTAWTEDAPPHQVPSPEKHRLILLTEPADAQVRLMDYPEPYDPSLSLPPRRYHFQVSAPGYTTENGYIDLLNQDWSGVVKLTPLPASESPCTQETASLEKERQQLLKDQQSLASESQLLEEKRKALESKETKLEESLKLLASEQKKLAELQEKNLKPETKTAPKPPKSVPPPEAHSVPLPITLSDSSTVEEEVERVMTYLKEFRTERDDGAPLAKPMLEQLELRAPLDPGVQKARQLYETRFMVYVGLFSTDKNAASTESSLHALNLPSFRQAVDIHSQSSIRVAAGPFLSREEAVAAQEIIQKKLGIQDAIIRKFRR